MKERRPLGRSLFFVITPFAFLVLSVLTIAIIFSLPKTFVATTRIDLMRKPPFDPYFIHTEFERIKSDAVVLPAILELRQIVKDFGRSRRAPMNDQALARNLLNNIDLRQSRGTALVEIRACYPDAQAAAIIANTIARIYAAQPKSATGPQSVEIVDSAEAPTRWVRPNRPMLIALATILNIIVAFLVGTLAAKQLARR